MSFSPMGARGSFSRSVQTQRLVKGCRSYLSSVYLWNPTRAVMFHYVEKRLTASLCQTPWLNIILQKKWKAKSRGVQVHPLAPACECLCFLLLLGFDVHMFWRHILCPSAFSVHFPGCFWWLMLLTMSMCRILHERSRLRCVAGCCCQRHYVQEWISGSEVFIIDNLRFSVTGTVIRPKLETTTWEAVFARTRINVKANSLP